MKSVLVFSSFFVFPLLGLLSLVEEEKKDSVIAVKAVYDPNNPPGFGRALHMSTFRHFLAKELANTELQIRQNTNWQKEEILVDIWMVEKQPFRVAILVTQADTTLLEGVLDLSNFASDAHAASYAAQAISQIIIGQGIAHPMSAKPKLQLANFAPRHLPWCPGRATFIHK